VSIATESAPPDYVRCKELKKQVAATRRLAKMLESKIQDPKRSAAPLQDMVRKDL